MNVTLTKSEMHIAAQLGCLRQLSSTFKGSMSKVPSARDWDAHICGAAGEMAVAKGLGIYNPMTLDTYRDADLGLDIQVKTRSEDHYDMILSEGDPSEAVYILVVGSMPDFRIVGWLNGKDAKKKKYFKSFLGNMRFVVPQSAFKSISTLPHKCIGRA